MNNIPPLAPLPRDQRNIDADHLNLLSIFYFVTAALAFLSILFFVGYYELMNYVFTNPDFWKNQKGGPPPVEIFDMVRWMFVVFGLLSAAGGILNLVSGLFLRQRKHRTFSLVVAAINCLQIPLGTVLGIFTIIVLIRPSVVEMYEAVERQSI
jgi:hypothetical protein